MHSKKLWTITAALIIPSAFAAVAATPAAAQSFGADAVEVLHERGVLTGTGCAPGDCDGILLRWEAALWLARAFDLTAEEPHRFVDVPTEGTVAEAVSALHPAGIEARCASEPLRFCPDQRATRAEMATFLSQAIGLEADDPAGFTDVDPDHPHAGSIDAISAAGITAGCALVPFRYCPDISIPRIQAAVLLDGALRHAREANSSPTNISPGDGTTGTGSPSGTTGNTGGTTGSPSGTTGNTGGTTGNTGGNTGSTGGTTVPEGANPGGGGPAGSNPTPARPTSRPGCAVVDHHDTHHDIDDHRGDPAGVQAWALLRDGTLFAHRHPTGGPARCWMWPPPDADGNSQNPQNARAPSHTH